jgi:hypothetical protein
MQEEGHYACLNGFKGAETSAVQGRGSSSPLLHSVPAATLCGCCDCTHHVLHLVQGCAPHAGHLSCCQCYQLSA